MRANSLRFTMLDAEHAAYDIRPVIFAHLHADNTVFSGPSLPEGVDLRYGIT